MSREGRIVGSVMFISSRYQGVSLEKQVRIGGNLDADGGVWGRGRRVQRQASWSCRV